MIPMVCGICRTELKWKDYLEHKCPKKKSTRREFLLKFLKALK